MARAIRNCCLTILVCIAANSGAGIGLPSANVPSRCQGGRVAKHLVVAARYDEDVSWMAIHLEVPFLVYQAVEDNETESSQSKSRPFVAHAHSNFAKEGSAFLTFIAEYYDCLPEVTAFVHAHRSSWHSLDMVEDLHNLQWSQVDKYLPLSMGYFETYGPWFLSYPQAPQRHLANPVIVTSPSDTLVGHEMLNGTWYLWGDAFHWKQASDVAIVWQDFLEPAGLGPLPEEIKYFCCAQFVVPSAIITRLPRDFYLQAIHWMENTEQQFHISARFSKAVALETVWHILFGESHILAAPKEGEKCRFYRC